MRKTSSTNYSNAQELHDYCEAAYTLSLISGRWKLTILVELTKGNNRFSLLKQVIPAITERVLALQLGQLEKDGLIIKSAIQEKNTPKNTYIYTLTVKGIELQTVINSLETWGKKHQPEI